jgi:phosphoglycolate phosphatase-like HAD superfamily hydrolase
MGAATDIVVESAVPADLSEFDAVVFDCDGVLLDSNALKVSAFRKVVAQAGFAPPVVDAFSQFQANNFGTSRHRLFDMLLAGEFGPVAAVTRDQLLLSFGECCASGYIEVAETEGMQELLNALRAAVPLYIVSGSDEDELCTVMRSRGLADRFFQVFGSPANKIENLARVRADLGARGRAADKLVFIGDAEADLKAAKAVGATFVFMSRHSLVREQLEPRALAGEFAMIECLADLLPGLVVRR